MSNLDRSFGIEIEFIGASRYTVAEAINRAGVDCQVEGYNHTTRSHWKIVTDASLEGSETGELVSPILQGAAGFAELKTVVAAINSVDGLTVNYSCGLHVHLDCRDMTVNEVGKTFERYANFESQIDQVMPLSRRSSRWCHTINTSSKKQLLASAIRSGEKYDLADIQGKFYKVNLTNVATRGAIEFRQHSGTTDYTKISNWVIFLMEFVGKSIELANQDAGAVTFRGRKTVAFDIARKVVAHVGGEMKWAGKSYTISLNGRDVKVSPATIEGFYNNGDRNSFQYDEFLTSLQSWTNQALSLAIATDDNNWLEGISTEIQTYLTNRIEALAS